MTEGQARNNKKSLPSSFFVKICYTVFMSYEVELKAKIDKYEALKQQLSAFSYQKTEVKTDRYFKQEGSTEPVRVRQTQNETIVTHKLRSKQDGVAINQELEFQVDNALHFEEFLKRLGLSFYKSKTKKVELYSNGPINYELVTLDGLGHFIEIERIVELEDELEEARNDVLRAFEQLGFKPNQLETKSYIAMMNL
jgi:adenylate cyclase class 2